MAAFSEMFEDTTIEKALDNLHTLSQNGAITASVDVQNEIYGTTQTFALAMDMDSENQAVSGSLRVSTDNGYMELGVSAKENVLMLSVPQLSQQVLSVNTLTLGKDAQGSFFGSGIPADTSFSLFSDKKEDSGLWDALKEECGSELKAFQSSVALQKVETRENGTLYTVKADREAACTLVEKLADFFQNQEAFMQSAVESDDLDVEEIQDAIRNSSGVLQVFINKSGYLTELSYQDDGETLLQIQLLGEKNPWERFTVSLGGEYVECSMQNENGRLVLRSGEDTFTLEKNGDFKVETPAGETASGHIGSENGGMRFDFRDMSQDDLHTELSVALLPLQKEPAQLSSTPTEIFTLTENDLYSLIMEIQENISSDENVQGFLMDLDIL